MGVLNEPCLVLNRNWQAVTFMPVQTCIVTTMRDMACVVHPETFVPMSFDEWCDVDLEDLRWIKTSSTSIPAPEVIVLKRYGERPPRRVNFNRPNLWRRDEFSCQYCGATLPGSKLQVEHVLPRSKGGPTTWENCVAACGDCNAQKADKTPDQAGMRLRKQPHKPRWEPKIPVPKGQIRDIWVPFLRAEGIDV